MQLQDISIIARTETARTLRSARLIVPLILLALFAALVMLGSYAFGGASANLTTDIQGLPEEEQARVLNAPRLLFIAGMFGFDPALVDALKALPLVLLVFLKAAFIFLPAFVALLAFDQISGEIGPRSIRYLVVRTRRSSILIAKFLTQAVTLIICVLAVYVIVFTFALFQNPDLEPKVLVVTFLRFFLASVLFGLTYLGLSFLCSSLFKSSAISLVMNLIALFIFWLVSAGGAAFGSTIQQVPGELIGKNEIDHWSGYLSFASPWTYGSNLIHPDAATAAVSVVALVAFTALFLGLAYAILRARDL